MSRVVVDGILFFFSSRRRHTIFDCDWSSDVCSSDLLIAGKGLVFQLPKGKTFRTSSLQQLSVSGEEIKPSFDIIKNNGSIEIKATVNAGGLMLDLKNNEAGTPLFYLYNHQLYVWKVQPA